MVLLKPLQDAYVRHAQSAAAFQRYADSQTAWRLHGGQCGAGGSSGWMGRFLCYCGSNCEQSGG
jgi:hypothetical protein